MKINNGVKTMLIVGATLTIAGAGALGEGAKWVSLFDGKTMKGWEAKAVHGGNGGVWTVSDKALVGDQEKGGGGGLLGTTTLYKDAEVYVEFKADYPVDSGLFLRTTPTGDAYQITIDNRPDGTIGWLYVPSASMVAEDKDFAKKYKPNEWNKMKAIVTTDPATAHTRVRAYLNGKLTVDYTDTTKRLAEPGYVGLQVHGGPGVWGDDCRIRFRAVKVKSLSPPSTP